MRKLHVSELGRKTISEFKAGGKLPVVIILDNVRSLYNVGVVFRSADAFAVESVILCGITPRPPHRAIEKTALGATKSVHWKYFQNPVDEITKLKSGGFIIAAVEQVEGSIPLPDFIPEKGRSYAFVFGHEVKGISQEALDLCDFSVEIPQFGTKHSLNVGVTASIVLWDYLSKTEKGEIGE